MLLKFSSFCIAGAISYVFFQNPGIFRRWVVLDGWELRAVQDYYTREAAQAEASQMNEEGMYLAQGNRYHAVHKCIPKEWIRDSYRKEEVK